VVAGFERQLGHGLVVSARYIDRRLKRVVEDVSGVSPEGAVGGEVQQFIISNPSKSTDLFLNEVSRSRSLQLLLARVKSISIPRWVDLLTPTAISSGDLLGSSCASPMA